MSTYGTWQEQHFHREANTVLSNMDPTLPARLSCRQSHDLHSPTHAMLPWGLCSSSAPTERGDSLHAVVIGSGWMAAKPCHMFAMLCRLADQFTEEVAWTPLTPSTQLSIMRDPGLVNSTAHRKLSLAVSSNGTDAAVGVVNSGYWGIPVDSGSELVLSMRIKRLDVSDTTAKVRRLASNGPHAMPCKRLLADT